MSDGRDGRPIVVYILHGKSVVRDVFDSCEVPALFQEVLRAKFYLSVSLEDP